MKERVEKRAKRLTEEIESAAGDLVARVKGLLAEGNVRRLIIKNTGAGVCLKSP